MKRLFAFLVILAAAAGTYGCGGGGPTELPPDTGEAAPENPDLDDGGGLDKPPEMGAPPPP